MNANNVKINTDYTSLTPQVMYDMYNADVEYVKTVFVQCDFVVGGNDDLVTVDTKGSFKKFVVKNDMDMVSLNKFFKNGDKKELTIDDYDLLKQKYTKLVAVLKGDMTVKIGQSVNAYVEHTMKYFNRLNVFALLIRINSFAYNAAQQTTALKKYNEFQERLKMINNLLKYVGTHHNAKANAANALRNNSEGEKILENVNALEGTVSDLTNQISDLQNLSSQEKSSLNAQIRDLQAQMSQMNSSIDHYVEENEKKDKEIEQLAIELKAAKEYVASFYNAIDMITNHSSNSIKSLSNIFDKSSDDTAVIQQQLGESIVGNAVTQSLDNVIKKIETETMIDKMDANAAANAAAKKLTGNVFNKVVANVNARNAAKQMTNAAFKKVVNANASNKQSLASYPLTNVSNANAENSKTTTKNRSLSFDEVKALRSTQSGNIP